MAHERKRFCSDKIEIAVVWVNRRRIIAAVGWKLQLLLRKVDVGDKTAATAVKALSGAA